MELEEKEARVQTVYALEGEKLRALREDLEHERAEREEQQDTERDVREKVVEERNQMVQRLEEQQLWQEVIEKCHRPTCGHIWARSAGLLAHHGEAILMARTSLAGRGQP